MENDYRVEQIFPFQLQIYVYFPTGNALKVQAKNFSNSTKRAVETSRRELHAMARKTKRLVHARLLFAVSVGKGWR